MDFASSHYSLSLYHTCINHFANTHIHARVHYMHHLYSLLVLAILILSVDFTHYGNKCYSFLQGESTSYLHYGLSIYFFCFLIAYMMAILIYIICPVVTLPMISFGCDYHWAQKDSRFDHEVCPPYLAFLN